MADRTPSTVSTSSSRIADGSTGSSGATDTEWGASVESEVEWGDAGIVGCGIGGAGTDHVDADGGDGTGGNSTVSDDQVPSVAALTFSIQKTYRHLAARLERFLTIRLGTDLQWAATGPVANIWSSAVDGGADERDHGGSLDLR